MSSPLHQFEIEPLIDLPNIGGLDIAFTNSSLFMVLAVIAVTLLVVLPMRQRALIPGRWQSVVEMYYGFVVNLVRDSASPEARKFFPFIFTLFSFILFGNLLGMLPYSFTFTSHIAVTFAMAAFIFVLATVVGFVKHGLHFFSFFLPEGTPWYIAPILIPIEIFSYFIRPVTLSVRLFANIMAGHILLKVFITFAATAGIIGILPLAMSVAFIGLEFFVAGLQAYIFTLLTCVYIRDALHLH